MDKLRRSFIPSKLKTRDLDESDELVIEGYFVVFDSETELFDGFFEEIAPTAFDRSLEETDVLALNNHDLKDILGRMSNNTLELEKDDRGLWGRIRLNRNDPDGVSAYQKVKTGLIKGCSFAFYPTKEEVEERDDGSIKIRIVEAELGEVSICTNPAYPQTEIAARQKQADSHKKRSIESRKKSLKKRLEGFRCSNN